MADSDFLKLATNEEAFLAAYDRHGVAFLEGFLSPEECKTLLERVLEQAELEREQGVAELSTSGTASELQIADMSAEDTLLQAVSFLPNKGRPFIDLVCGAAMERYCNHAFHGVASHLTSASATIIHKGAAAQVIHSDQQAWPFLTPVPAMLSFAVCLTDFMPENGATCFVPGTRDGPPPAIGWRDDLERVGNLDSVEPMAFAAPAGTLAMWDGRIWHGQGGSTAEKPRIGIVLSYAMHMVRPQENLPASVHDDVYATLSDEEKRRLGFEVVFEYAGRIAPRHPQDPRRNTNFSYPYVPELSRSSEARAVKLDDAAIGHTEMQAKLVG
jgi:ectoine hydroxylase-related dioxygenase (phytanoyl-CoA dioxygenase family)